MPTAEEIRNPSRRRKARSPSYPGIALDTAVERVQALYEEERRHPAPIASILDHWGYNPKSSGGLIAVAALKKYGLLEDEGSGEGRLAKLSERGLAIVEDTRPTSPERDKAIEEAALGPKINREVWDKYEGDLPSDSTIQHFLVREKGFTPQAALHYLRLLRRSIAYAGLGDSDSVSDDEAVAEENRRLLLDPPNPSRVARVNPKGQAIQLPLPDTAWATLQASFPLTEAAWDHMLRLLEAMKPGLVRETENTDPGE